MMNSTRAQLAIAYLNTLTFSCVQMILYTTIPYISEQTGVATATIIAAISVGSLLFAGFSPYWATRSDALGRKKVLSFGMLGMGLSFILLSSLFIFNDTLSLSAKIAIVFLARIVYGLLASAIVPVSQAWQLDLIDEAEKIKVMTRNSMCLNLGRILGPVIILFKKVNFEFMIYGATIWILTLATSCFLTSTSALKNSSASQSLTFKEILRAQSKKWKVSIHESLYPILLALIFTGFVGILHTFLGHHLKVTLDIRGDQATVLMAKIVLVLSLIALIVQQTSIWLLKSAWKPRVLIGSSSLVAGSFVLMQATSEAQIWFSVVLISFATALIPPAYLALVSQSKSAQKESVYGKKVGLASIAHSLGYALGAALIALSMKLHILSEAAVVMIVSLSIMVVVILMIRSTKYNQPSSTARSTDSLEV